MSLDFWDSIDRLDINDLTQVIRQVENENNTSQDTTLYSQKSIKQVRSVKKVSQGMIQLLKDHIQQKYAKTKKSTREQELKDKNEHDKSPVEENIMDTEIIDQSDNFTTVGGLIKGKFSTDDHKSPLCTAKQALRDQILKIKYQKETKSNNTESSALHTSVREDSPMVFTQGRLTYDL